MDVNEILSLSTYVLEFVSVNTNRLFVFTTSTVFSSVNSQFYEIISDPHNKSKQMFSTKNKFYFLISDNHSTSVRHLYLFFILWLQLQYSYQSVCSSIYPFISLSIQSSLYLYVCPSIHPFISLSIRLSFNPSLHSSIYPFVLLFIRSSPIHVPIPLSIHSFVCQTLFSLGMDL